MDFARGIGEAHDRIGFCYVESISDECHPEWRMKLVEKYCAEIRDSVADGVAKKDDSFWSRLRASCARRKELEEKSLDALVVGRPLRRIGLGDKDVTVG